MPDHQGEIVPRKPGAGGLGGLEPEGLVCLDCGGDLSRSSLYDRYRVCPQCGYHYYLSARRWVDLLTDPGSFHETYESLVPLDPLSFKDNVTYKERLAQAQHVTGLMEAVVTGTGNIGGVPASIAALDFGFMGGTVGSAVGEKIALAAETALQKRISFLLVVCGGGPRIQEGALSLMQMAKAVATAKRLGNKGIPFITVLASPSTGHLYAGAASMADVILAEPRALIGFAPFRAAKQATQGPLPDNFHTAEFHLDHGMVDRIVDRRNLRHHLALVLDLFSFQYRLTMPGKPKRLQQVEQTAAAAAWDRVQMSRHQERPTSRDFIERIFSNFVELHGDRVYGDDHAIVTGMGYLAGEAVMVIAQERGRGDERARCHEGRIYPEGFRKAQRAMRLAEKFKLPVVTLVDTPGAYQGLDAEERGIGGAIATAMGTLVDLHTPVVSVIVGQGGSEAALALSVADRVLMLENAICTPVSPEAAAWILYRDPERADEVASALKLTAQDCRTLGIVDAVIPEPDGGAHHNFDETARQVERLLVQNLLDVQMSFTRTLLKNRFQKVRQIGSYGTTLQATLASEATRLQDLLRRGLRELLQGPQSDTPPQGQPRRLP